MIEQRGALVLDEAIVNGREEVVRCRGAVVLLGIQPTGREAGMPGQNELSPGRGPGR